MAASITFLPILGIHPEAANGADFEVRVDGVRRGILCRVGDANPRHAPVWRALGDEADAWTLERRTRKEAVADLLAGITFQHYANA